MTSKQLSQHRIRLLADFRHQLRMFLQFSEQAAARFDLHPQQHQLLLQIAGAPGGVQPTIGFATERLGLRHHTVVELCNRSQEAGLIVRRPDTDDRRKVILKLTPKGRQILEALSEDHAREINELAPRLIEAFAALGGSAKKTAVSEPGADDES